MHTDIKVHLDHCKLSHFGRILRIALNYKGISYQETVLSDKTAIKEQPKKRESFISGVYASHQEINIKINGMRLHSPLFAIEYLDELYHLKQLIVGNIAARIEQKMLFNILYHDMYHDVVEPYLIYYIKDKQPDCSTNALHDKCKEYLDYATMLLCNNDESYIYTDQCVSINDLALLTNLSLLEYIGQHVHESPNMNQICDWYYRMKSYKFANTVISDKSQTVQPANSRVI